jgi:putative transposase
VGDELSPSKRYLQNTDRHDIISRIVIYGGDTVELDNNNHSVFLMYYHLVFVIKYRRKVIDDQISNRLKEIFEYIAPNYNIALQEWNHDKDHVHMLFKAQPNSELSKFINAYKSASSRLIKKEYSTIKKILWKEHFWSRSFCLLTTGGAPIEVVRRYIESQGEKI